MKRNLKQSSYLSYEIKEFYKKKEIIPDKPEELWSLPVNLIQTRSHGKNFKINPNTKIYAL